MINKKLRNSRMSISIPDEDIYEKQLLLNRLDILPFSRWHLFISLALGIIWIFDGYQVSLISIFHLYIVKQYSEESYKLLPISYQIGCISGSLIFGFCGFVFGRRAIFTITLLIYLFGIILSMINLSIWWFIIGRYLTGVSVGGQFTAIFAAVDQFLPCRVRGRVNIGLDGTWHFGGIIAALLNLIIGQIFLWRLLFGIGLIGITSLFLIRQNVPESPRWLIMKQEHLQAEKIITLIEKAVQNKQFMLQILTIQPKQKQNFSNPPFLKLHLSKIRDILSQVLTQYPKRIFLSFSLIFSQGFFFSQIYYKYPSILQKDFNFTQKQISFYMLPLSLCSFISTLFIGPLFDNIGRKWMLLITYGTTGILLLLTLLSLTAVQLEVLMCVIFIFSSPAGSSANLIASEIFPTSSRTIMLSLMFISGMLGGVTGVATDSTIVSAILIIIAAIIAFYLCPSSEKKSLEQIQFLQ